MRFAAACLFLLAASLPGGAGGAAPVSFVAFGDMPYCDDRDPEGCRAELARL